jgi:isopropylmalate/homocitrate/citramalate synthase
MTAQRDSLMLLDCTLRDGGYYNAWDFSSDLINDYLRAMSALATDYVEVGPSTAADSKAAVRTQRIASSDGSISRRA